MLRHHGHHGGIFGHHGTYHHGGIFAHSHSHYHHNRRLPLGGALVGFAAGAAMANALSTPSYKTIYVAPAPVVHTETPEKAKARIQAKKLREEAQQRELESTTKMEP